MRLAADSRPGAGVGLFAARRLVGAMGGRLWIEDKLAGGTQFVTALARSRGHASMSDRPLRILVIDDEPAMVGAVAALVGSEGHRVIAAYDGDEGLQRFEGDRPDLVILDLAMPGLDGLAVCGAIREKGTTPIIVLSGEGQEEAKVEALDAGADDYVTKPFGKAELLARIRAVMRRPREERRVAEERQVGPDRSSPPRGLGQRPPPVADADRVRAARRARLGAR